MTTSVAVKPEEPRDAANRRITVTVMNKRAEERALGTPEETDVEDAEGAAAAIQGVRPEPATALEAAVKRHEEPAPGAPKR